MNEKSAPANLESEIDSFNHMALPRPVEFHPGKVEKRLFWMVLLVVLASSLIHIPALLEDWNLMKVRNTDVKELARIEEIRRQGSGKSSRTLITYSYQFGTDIYRSIGIERHGSHAVGNLVTVYVQQSDPRISHAEFALPESRDLRLRIFIVIGVALVFFLITTGIYYITFRIKKYLLQSGRMIIGKVIETHSGRSQIAVVEFSPENGSPTRQMVSSDRQLSLGDSVQIIYNPNRTKQVCLYPVSGLRLKYESAP